MRAKCLSEETNRNDMRKILINAQVKAMISFFETISNIVYVIMVWLTVRTSFGTLFQIIALYLVFLPYAALMNTSHNKDRIIKNGWKSVFKNLLGGKKNTAILQTDKKLTTNDRVQPKFIQSRNGPVDHCVPQSFTTNLSSNVTDPNEVIGLSKHAWLCDEPSTSNGQKAEKKASPHFSDTSSISTQQSNKNEENVTQTLILNMVENINEEGIYIKYFKNLVTHKYGGKNECKPSTFSLEVNALPHCVLDDEWLYKNTKGKGKHLKKRPRLDSRQLEIVMNVKELDELRNQQINLFGSKDDRIRMRGNLLDQIVDCDEQDEIYDSLLDKLINLEESFVR